MKKTALLSLVTILIFSLSAGYVLSKVSNMKITINAKDLSEEGLVIVRPSDFEFENLLSDFLKIHPIDGFEKIKPLSIFIKNNTSKIVVAHAIVWECINSTGEKRPHTIRYIEALALTDGVIGSRTEDLSNQTIYPNSYQLLTLLPISGANGGGSGSGGESIRKRNADLSSEEVSKDKSQNRNELIRNQILARCSEVTVSIDGAFFDDGVFVGADNTGFFGMTKALVEAKRDLTSSILIDSDSKKISAHQKWEKVMKLGQENLKSPQEGARPEEYYNYYRNVFAQQFTKAKTAQGEDRLLSQLKRVRSKSLPLIRKQSHS